MKTLKNSLILVTILAAMSTGSVLADQPHMHHALEHLRAAQAELRTAEHNKGGWRDRAMSNVERAIADVEKGMAAAR